MSMRVDGLDGRAARIPEGHPGAAWFVARHAPIVPGGGPWQATSENHVSGTSGGSFECAFVPDSA